MNSNSIRIDWHIMVQRQLTREGIGLAEHVELPVTFQPREANLAFVATDSGVEVWLPATVAYLGTDADLRVRMLAPPTGSARQLLPAHSDFAAAVAGLGALFRAESSARPPVQVLTNATAVIENLAKRKPHLPCADQLRTHILGNVRGQDSQVSSITSAVARHISKATPTAPLVLCLPGPTGTGKTSCVQELAVALKPLGYGLLTIDCNTLVNEGDVTHLTGAPPSYVGFGSTTSLADQLDANPKTIVLLDEIEKAHSAVMTVLMGAFDAGRLQRKGHMGADVSCEKSIFILTSNAAADALVAEIQRRSIWDNESERDHTSRTILRTSGLRPEIVGRLTAVIPFRPLDGVAHAEISALGVARTCEEYGHICEFVAPEVVALLLDGDSAGGARSPKRDADRLLGAQLASLAAEYGPCRVVVHGPHGAVRKVARLEE